MELIGIILFCAVMTLLAVELIVIMLAFCKIPYKF
jgi:hypothetical protein